MKSFLAALVLFVAPSLFASDFGVRYGEYRDSSAEFVGVEMLFDLGALNINPNIEYSLENDTTAGSANLDVTFDLGKFSRFTPYAGAGVGIQYVDDAGGNRTDALGNLIGGVSVDLGVIKPYGQVKWFRVLGDENGLRTDDVALVVGLRF